MLAPLALLLVLAELTLWGLGLGEPHVGPPASRGFDPRAEYLRPVDGGWVTQLFDRESREQHIPPKGAARRVLLFGGSNTQTFPELALTDLLRQGSPADDRGWEVINLGREGYGSGRVSILFDQALALRPDVVVIYSGHNEFVERGFQLELEEARGGEVERSLVSGLSDLRLFRVLEEALRQRVAPEPLAAADPAEREIPWAQTQTRYAAYRVNLEHMCDQALAAGVQVVLCTLVGNPLAPPFVSTLPTGLPPEQAAGFEGLRQQGQARIPLRLRDQLRPPTRLRLASWTRGDGLTPEELATGIPALRPLLGALAETPATAPEHGDDASVAGHHWTPTAQWMPEVLPLLRAVDAVLSRDLNVAERRSLGLAQPLLEQARAIVPDDPSLLFDLGLTTWLLGGHDAQAVELLLDAAAHDRSPHSANRVVNGIVREVAAARPGVRLLDAERLFTERCPDGLVGYEVMMDSCHLHPGARRVLMADLAARLLELAAR